MPQPLDPHRDHSGTFEDSFLFQLAVKMFGGLVWDLVGLGLRLSGWLFWQVIRLLCAAVSEALSSWHF